MHTAPKPEITPLAEILALHTIRFRRHDVYRGCRGCGDDDPQCRGYYICACGEAFPDISWCQHRMGQHLADIVTAHAL